MQGVPIDGYARSLCTLLAKLQTAPDRHLLQSSLLADLTVSLNRIPDFEARPVVKAHPALGSLAHLLDVLLDVLEGS